MLGLEDEDVLDLASVRALKLGPPVARRLRMRPFDRHHDRYLRRILRVVVLPAASPSPQPCGPVRLFHPRWVVVHAIVVVFAVGSAEPRRGGTPLLQRPPGAPPAPRRPLPREPEPDEATQGLRPPPNRPTLLIERAHRYENGTSFLITHIWSRGTLNCRPHLGHSKGA